MPEKLTFSLMDTQEYADALSALQQAMSQTPDAEMTAEPMGPAMMFEGQPARPMGPSADGAEMLLILGGPRKGQRVPRTK